jgi:hypothetical protein
MVGRRERRIRGGGGGENRVAGMSCALAMFPRLLSTVPYCSAVHMLGNTREPSSFLTSRRRSRTRYRSLTSCGNGGSGGGGGGFEELDEESAFKAFGEMDARLAVGRVA